MGAEEGSLEFALGLRFEFIVSVSFSQMSFRFFPFRQDSSALPFAGYGRFGATQASVPVRRRVRRGGFRFPRGEFV